VSVMVLGEFATSAALSGRKVNLLGNIIVTQVGSLKWALASVVGVILTIIMAIVVAGFLRIIDLKKEL
jgi:putative spermidine/putrescine transport system permease protein